ncbi:MAG: precorrin-6y C5,15-methyltransferase (decarboxylating) subunit CbiE [Chloroflexi bacterium]|nr:precorrin-6y C5,15-methyltransferase (decarboxylating) subunit CbiE [Chloroflexota bacterium]
MPSVYVVGVGEDGAAGLGQRALDIINSADVLCGGRRLLGLVPQARGRKIPIEANLRELVDAIREFMVAEQVVVLASGDPGFFGIARYLADNLGKERLEIVPGVSAVQLAFARIKESWDDAVLTSVHGRDIGEIVEVVRSSKKIGVLTDPLRSPAQIARVLLASGISGYRCFVCQNLGSNSESIVETDLGGLVSLAASPLSVLILLKQGPEPKHSVCSMRPSLGIPDDEFLQRRPLKGLITKCEIRVVSLSKMSLREDSVVWDIGAGSGSVSVEAALIATTGRVFAVEKNPADAEIVRWNLHKFGVDNAVVVEGLAPEVLTSLPDPDVVFIGGSGGHMEGILDATCRRLKSRGSLVANIATVANLYTITQGLAARRFDVDVALVNVARSRGIADLMRFEALDPVFVVSARRSELA